MSSNFFTFVNEPVRNPSNHILESNRYSVLIEINDEQGNEVVDKWGLCDSWGAANRAEDMYRDFPMYVYAATAEEATECGKEIARQIVENTRNSAPLPHLADWSEM